VANQIFYPGDGFADTYSIAIAPKFSRLDVVRFPMDADPPRAYAVGGDDDPKCPTPTTGSNKQFAKLVEIRNLYVCARDRLVDQAALELKLQVAQLGLVRMKDNKSEARRFVSTLLFGATNNDADDQSIEQKMLELQGSLADKRREANKAASALRLAVNTPNLLVTRWTAERTNSQGLTVGAIWSGDRQARTQTSGILILGDLRITSLRFGEDFIASLIETDLSNFERGLGIVTTTLQSKYQLEIQDIDFSSILAAQLTLSADDLAILGDGPLALLRQQSLKISTALAELASIGNAGSASNAHPEEYAFSFYPWDVYQDALKLECQRSRGYTTVYSVRAVGSQLVERVLKEASLTGDQMKKIREVLHAETGTDSKTDRVTALVKKFLEDIERHKVQVQGGRNECATAEGASTVR
jgi:hypothetical protein